MTKKIRTRRDTLGMIGAASFTALVGCGGDDHADTTATGAGTGGASGAGGASTGGNGGAGTAGSGGGTAGGAGGGAQGGGAGSGGANGMGGAAGTGGTASDGGLDTDARGGAAGGEGGAVEGGTDVGQRQCAAKQETTVGPFPNIDPLERRDIRGNTQGDTTPKQGVEFVLRMRVYDLDAGCAPIAGAVVDVWSCEATGKYAGYAAFTTTGQDFCRGYQRTDAQGQVEFLTIFPGSYTGRAIHIHYSIQGTPQNLTPNAEGSQLPTTAVAQLYFPRAVADDVFAAMPIYQQGAAITPNESDGIYAGQGGRDLVVNMTKSATGYVGEVDIGVRRGDIGK